MHDNKFMKTFKFHEFIYLGERFIKEADGLRIYGIKESDNGNYTCRAEIGTDGRYDERKIEVTVHSKSQGSIDPSDRIEWLL